MNVDLSRYAGKRVLITGGLGFIGSNLALYLDALGAEITIYDSLRHDHGGNVFNIEPIADRARVVIGDIRDADLLASLVKGRDFIFHLAGQNDHLISQRNPFEDIDINIRGTTIVLEAIREHAPGATVIYTGTRGEYGAVQQLPADEETPTNPLGIYELSSLASQKLFTIYARNHGMSAISLRLSNVYGERAQMLHHRFGVANWFVRLALDGQPIQVMGDGTIKRDFLHVDDCVSALAGIALHDAAMGDVYNVGNPAPDDFKTLAETAVRCAGSGSWTLVPFTAERKKQEPGDFYPSIAKIEAAIGWRPAISLDEGIARTVEYYRAHASRYWRRQVAVAGV